MISLKQLKYFVAVAETRNFRRAAEQVFLSQPSLSQQVKKLEQELGVMLLERDQHHVELTLPGEVFLREAKRALAQVERAVREAREVAGLDEKQLTVGLPEALSADLLPLVERFRQKHPDVILELTEMDTPDLVASLHTGHIGIGLAGISIHDTEINTLKVLSIPFIVALSETHPLAKRKALRLIDLSDSGLILLSRQDLPPLYDYLTGFLRAAGLNLDVVRHAKRFQRAMSLVASGVGVHLCPASYQKVGRAGVVFVELEPPRPELTVVAAWHKQSNSDIVRMFLEGVGTI